MILISFDIIPFRDRYGFLLFHVILKRSRAFLRVFEITVYVHLRLGILSEESQ